MQKLQFNQQNWLYIVHHLSDKTGGVVLSTWSGKYDAELDHIISELQGRYQLGFRPPTLDGKRHDLQVKLTDNARARLKSIDLRYAPSFLASHSALPADLSPESKAKAALSLALGNTASYVDIRFDASGKSLASGQPLQLRLFIDPRSLSWNSLENGDRKAVVTVAIAGISSGGAVLGPQAKQFEVFQTKAEQSSAAPKAVIIGTAFPLPPDSVRVRFILQDISSEHLGSFELPVSGVVGLLHSAPPPG